MILCWHFNAYYVYMRAIIKSAGNFFKYVMDKQQQLGH